MFSGKECSRAVGLLSFKPQEPRRFGQVRISQF